MSFVDPRKLVAGDNPFVGLRPFGIADADVFFGREAQVATVLQRLRGTRFLAVVGASGCGKSSLVLAGLIPALPRDAAERTGPSWRIAVMRPGSAPIAALARVLARTQVLGVQADDPDAPRAAMLERLQRDQDGLADLVARANLRKGQNVLVVVDQFEELFRFTSEPDRAARAPEAAAFVKLLLTAAARSDLPVSIAITMRSDFIGDCAHFDGLAKAVNDGLFLVPRLTHDEMWRAIEQPVLRRGEHVTPQLVARLLDDATADADQLPKLEHALMRTWDAWSNDHTAGEPLDERHYEQIGEMRGAVSTHANEIYDALDPRLAQIAERLFCCLTARDSENRKVRRPTTVSAVLAVTGARPGEIERLVRIYAAPAVSFLTASGPLSNLATVLDLTHESVMRLWDRLRAWVDDEAESGDTYRRLVADAAAPRPHWADPELAVGEAWLAKYRASINSAWAARYDDALGGLPSDGVAGSRSAHERFDAALAFLNASAAAPRRSAGMIIALVALVFVAAVALAIVGFGKYNQTVAERHRVEERARTLDAAIAKADQSRHRSDLETERAKASTATANQRTLDATRIVKADAEKRRRAEQQAKASPSASPRATASPRASASPSPSATPRPSPSPRPTASPRPVATQKPAPATPRPVPARNVAAAGAPANASCGRAVEQQRLAADATMSRRAAYDAAVAGLVENAKCENKSARLVNEGYLRSTLAAAEHDLGVGDWKADLNRANQLLAQCETQIALQTTRAPADCRAQRQFNEQAAAEFSSGSPAPR